jgi:hypothetical protein
MNTLRLKEIADALRSEILKSAQAEDIDPEAEGAAESSIFRVTQLAKLEAAEEIIRGVVSRDAARAEEAQSWKEV